MLSHVQLFAIPWTIAHKAPVSMVFSRQEYWSGLPCPPPGDLPNPGIESMSPALEGRFVTTGASGKSLLGFVNFLSMHLNQCERRAEGKGMVAGKRRLYGTTDIQKMGLSENSWLVKT